MTKISVLTPDSPPVRGMYWRLIAGVGLHFNVCRLRFHTPAMNYSLGSMRATALTLVGSALSKSVWAQEAITPMGTTVDLTPVAQASGLSSQVWLTFGLDRVAVFPHRPVADIPLWQYLASLIYIFLAFYISKCLDFLIRERVRKWAGEKPAKLEDLFVSLVRGPVQTISFVVLLHIGMRIYSWPPAISGFLFGALNILVVCSITYVLLKAVDVLLGLWRERITTTENEQFSRQLLPLIRKSLMVFVVVVALLVTSQNIGLNLTGLIASLSIGGLALSLSAQDTLPNLFGAFAVLIDRPFKVGNRIQLDKVDGTVRPLASAAHECATWTDTSQRFQTRRWETQPSSTSRAGRIWRPSWILASSTVPHHQGLSVPSKS